MTKVRIHLAQMPVLLSQMISDLLAPETDMEIVGCADGTRDSLLAARAEGANMIIMQEKATGGELCLDAVVDDPPLTILAIAPNGSTSASINISRQEIGLPAGADSLADVVRKAAGLS